MSKQNENLVTEQKNQTNKRYIFAQKDGEDFSCIKLAEGKYKDIIYKYDKVKFAPEANANGEIPLKFTYDIFLNPNKVEVKDTEFKNYIGDILLELVEDQLKNGTMVIDE
jgi:hypothetical protein|tara:strand:+ start:143 stop:472 length:330 start_codon:yes stop_codon:yes gene_type:complete